MADRHHGPTPADGNGPASGLQPHRLSGPHQPAGPHRLTGPVVAGVVPGQPPAVTRHAADLAFSLGVDLVCAYVDVTTYLVDEDPDGRVESLPIDPDVIDDDAENIAGGIHSRLASELEPYGIAWSFVTLAGDPSRALARLAETVNAAVIVVGTRERGIGKRLEELLTGSVAVHLTHRQHRPVLVIPLNSRMGAGESA
ncbi:universal stress protein [Pseudarthrobacter sp. N5]|uniref:universal stress protein n=1 Tax=Pseudarthrobacter sp. N5 TaxID=3418416 RepID=UPI003CFB3D65